MPNRYDLDAAMEATRRPLDAGWSKRKKTIVGSSCAAGAIAALSIGAWAMSASTPPPLPRSAQEAIAVLSSDRFERMDADRRRQYAAEAQRLLASMSPEERREMMRDVENREAMRALGEELFDDAARRFARGEEMPQPFWGGGVRRTDREGPPVRMRDENAERPTPEQIAEMREQMRQRMEERLAEQFRSGNAQSAGLRAEMFKRMMRSGGGVGGPGRGGMGGARRGGGGGSGGGGSR